MCCYMTCLSANSIIPARAPCTACRPLLSLSACPSNVAIVCHLLPVVLIRPLSGCWPSGSLLVCSTIRALGLCISCVGVFLCFLLYIRFRIKTLVLMVHGCHVRWRWVTSTLAFNHPQLPCIWYCSIITAVNGKCYLLFFLCVNFWILR